MRRFEDQVVVVTGGAQGIGAATAARFADEGAIVAVVDITAERCDTTVEKIKANGGRAIAIGADISKAAAAAAAIETVIAEFGKVDVMVNNAGVTRDNLLFKMTEEDWDVCVDVSLKGAFLMAQAAQKHMVPARHGKIISLSSVSALGNRGQANYSAAKAGVQGLTATMAQELGPYNINVNAVAPGFVHTPMTEATAARLKMTVEDFMEQAGAGHPLRRVAQPEDIAAVVAFLASEDARHITGQTVYVNGGRSAV